MRGRIPCIQAMKKRRRQTPARRLYVAEDNLGKYIKIRDIQDVFGWDYTFCKDFLAAMAALDRDYEKGVETFSSFALKGLRKIHRLPVVTVDSLDDSWIFRGFGGLRGFLRDEIYIKKRSAYAQATSLVLLDGRYKGQPVRHRTRGLYSLALNSIAKKKTKDTRI